MSLALCLYALSPTMAWIQEFLIAYIVKLFLINLSGISNISRSLFDCRAESTQLQFRLRKGYP